MNFKTRIELIDLFEQKRLLNKGAEIGSLSGIFAKDIMQKWKGDLILVDPWRKFSDEDYKDSCNEIDHQQTLIDCLNNLKSYEERIHPFKTTSEFAANMIKNESLDFVYIDANHKYDAVKKDLELWYPKVRKGGVFAGHDYLKMDWYADPNFLENKKDKNIFAFPDLAFLGVFGVNPAVDEFCDLYNYKLNSTTDEWTNSWFIIK
jgi:hypothetical protein